MKNTYFITGIGTEVGKTITAAIVTQVLQADYWKPVQAGELEHTDTHKVQALVSCKKTTFYPSAYNLQAAMSPHAAAALEEIQLEAKKITRPAAKNDLVIEGAGGLLVPLNDTETMIDLIKETDKVIVVSRHYLGSINHTLLTIEAIQNRGFTVFGIIFNGDENTATENIIQKMTGISVLGRIENEPYFDKNVILEYAEIFRKNLQP